MKVLKIIDQWGWAFHFVGMEQQRYSRHEIDIARVLDVLQDPDEYTADVVYFHSPVLCMGSDIRAICESFKKRHIPIIGGYGAETKTHYDLVDAIVSISYPFTNELKRMYMNKPVVFLPESVDSQYFKPNKNKHPFTTGWAGRNMAVKRTHLLDQLSVEVVRKSDHGSNFFLRDRTLDPMLAFYESLSVFLLTSLSECMPRVVLEAMSCGLPVVSTAVGSLPLLIGEYFLTNSNNENEIIRFFNDRILELKESKTLAKEAGKANRETIVKRFSWIVNQPLWDDVFEKVANGQEIKDSVFTA